MQKLKLIKHIFLYLLFAPSQLVCMVFCWLTNWIVVLFADENGELPGALHLWQTWDDTLDNKSYIERDLPKFLNYNWDEHYVQYTNEIYGTGRTRYREELIKPFTIKEKIQRYFCRVAWINRNCGYGFAFYAFYAKASGKFSYKIEEEDRYLLIDDNGVFAYKDSRVINKYLRFCTYIGWKVSRSIDHPHQVMIATRFSIHRNK